MPSSIYYIRKNATAQLPSNLLFFDTETQGELIGEVELHTMYMATSWRVVVGPKGELTRESWRDWDNSSQLCQYIAGEARKKAPLYVIGSNVTFDLFSSGLIEHLDAEGWQCESLYDKGLVTILIATKDGRKIKACAAQNWLQGGVKSWGKLLGIEKMEVDFATDNHDTVLEYCRRDTEITGRAVLGYMDFVRAHDMGGFALTAAGQALRCYRHRFMPDRSILHYDQSAYNAFTRAAYTGGRVEAGHIGQLTGDYTKVDINSMYPHVMRSNKYPGKLRQWVRDPTLERTQQKLDKGLCIAEVELDTDEPAYALRTQDKLLFPLGQFTTFLCTASLQYALDHHHVVKVKQLLTFDSVDLFSGYVDYFYPLKQQYKDEGNGVWEKTTKLMLNGLYGKFGERRSREISREHTPDVCPTREPGLYSRDVMEEENPRFCWRYEPLEESDPEFVRGVKWQLLNTTVTEVGEDEGPGSAPAIAAHVTDYARMLLYSYLQKVGLDDVLYCDTDSIILQTQHLDRLADVIHPDRLGALKVEGREAQLEIRGAKDYSFGGELHRKGIKADAVRVCRKCRIPISEDARACVECGEHVRQVAFRQAQFPGFYSLLRRGLMGSFPVGIITKTLTGNYSKGKVSSSGKVTPHRLTAPA
jgi:hypothetical protein